MNDTKFRAKIIAALRKLTYSWPARNEAKNAAKVAPATFECASCGVYCYTGKSVGKEEILEEELGKKVIAGRIYIDHIEPIIDPEKGFTTWDSYINNMFCSIDNLQPLCHDCNQKKTKKENTNRRRKKKKK